MARRVLQRAASGVASAPRDPRNHVGYYLLGAGKAEFQADLGYRPGLHERLLEAVLRNPHTVYFGSIAGLMVLFLVPLLLAGFWTAGSAWARRLRFFFQLSSCWRRLCR